MIKISCSLCVCFISYCAIRNLGSWAAVSPWGWLLVRDSIYRVGGCLKKLRFPSRAEINFFRSNSEWTQISRFNAYTLKNNLKDEMIVNRYFKKIIPLITYNSLTENTNIITLKIVFI